jgi:hypothetical protein
VHRGCVNRPTLDRMVNLFQISDNVTPGWPRVLLRQRIALIDKENGEEWEKS